MGLSTAGVESVPLPRSWLPAVRLFALVGLAACSEDGPGDPGPRFFAVAYGTVRQGADPVSGIEVRAEVFTSVCPVTGTAASQQNTRSGTGGRYRLLLTSESAAAGQCLRMTAATGTPVVTQLTDMPFSASSGAEVQDSVEVDLTIP